MTATAAQFIAHMGRELLGARDDGIGHKGIVGGVQDQGGDGDLAQQW